jgi:hypothetical protein
VNTSVRIWEVADLTLDQNIGYPDVSSSYQIGRDIGEDRQIRQTPRTLPLAKQADVGEMLEDMQRSEVTEESDSP